MHKCVIFRDGIAYGICAWYVVIGRTRLDRSTCTRLRDAKAIAKWCKRHGVAIPNQQAAATAGQP